LAFYSHVENTYMTTSFDLEGDEWAHETILPRYLLFKCLNQDRKKGGRVFVS